jgi:hypothetical protein
MGAVAPDFPWSPYLDFATNEANKLFIYHHLQKSTKPILESFPRPGKRGGGRAAALLRGVENTVLRCIVLR